MLVFIAFIRFFITEDSLWLKIISEVATQLHFDRRTRMTVERKTHGGRVAGITRPVARLFGGGSSVPSLPPFPSPFMPTQVSHICRWNNRGSDYCHGRSRFRLWEGGGRRTPPPLRGAFDSNGGQRSQRSISTVVNGDCSTSHPRQRPVYGTGRQRSKR